MFTSLISIFVVVVTIEGNEICKDTLKALIEARHEEFHRDFVSLKNEVKRDLREMNKLKKEVQTLKESLKKIGTGNGYGSYVRWGRNSCPKGAEFVYKGYVGGSGSGGTGSSNPICLPEKPQYGVYRPGRNNQGLIYGSEYETFRSNSFSPFQNFGNQDVPCAVCKTIRSAVIMVPARKTCQKGWTREYHGYLMSGHYGHKSSSDYICVDGKPEAVTGGQNDVGGNLLYLVEATCGALKCPPYDNSKELTCVVCSA